MKVKVPQSHPTLCNPMDYTVLEILKDRILEWVAFPFSGRSSQPKDWTQVSLIAGGFFRSWATVKPKNTRVGSLSLLQQILPTQELNQGLLHCGWILYQLSYQGSPIIKKAREFQRNTYFCFIDYAKASVWSQQTVENSSRDGNTKPPDLSPEKSECRSRNNS